MKLCTGNTPPAHPFLDIETAGAFESLIQSLLPRAPANTPQDEAGAPVMVATERKLSHQMAAEASQSKFE
jgi:hypothetical protein